MVDNNPDEIEDILNRQKELDDLIKKDKDRLGIVQEDLIEPKKKDVDIYEEIEKVAPYKTLIENLTKSYFDYKNYIKKNYVLSNDFHGSRDFYYLIKITARALKNNVNKKSLESIAMESIERNFGGMELDKEGNTLCPSTKKFKETLVEWNLIKKEILFVLQLKNLKKYFLKSKIILLKM